MIGKIMRWVSRHILLAPFMLLMIVFSFGCKSTKYVPLEEKVNVRDSIVYKDSTILRDSTVMKDSIIFKDSTVLVVDENGKVVRTELYRYKEVYSQLQSKYNKLVDKYNALYAEKQKEKLVPYPVERNLTRWEKIKLNVGGYSIIVAIIVLLIVIGKFVFRFKIDF